MSATSAAAMDPGRRHARQCSMGCKEALVMTMMMIMMMIVEEEAALVIVVVVVPVYMRTAATSACVSFASLAISSFLKSCNVIPA